ncbi:MAG: hypothetical protein L3J79_00280 [Candidatus Marinimicrobia bacterium]|nr:hypothetical protein [Candidatus Neomarinimicrobiota bacterium]
MMITDSGLGGLSVCAGLEQELVTRATGTEIELLYINATPDDRIGYNSLKTQQERMALFDRFLFASYARYAPDEIAIACNTLSVIYGDTEFASHDLVKVRGIVGAGVTLCNTALKHKPDHKLIIFATETTVEADTYPRSIKALSSSIVSQACPGLAHAISNDSSGADCKQLLNTYMTEALEQIGYQPDSVYVFLGCTHYGYQSQVFHECFNERGIEARILNPNELLVQQLLQDFLSQDSDPVRELGIRFISRYHIPQVEVNSIQDYLQSAAPLTMAALLDHEVVPDLFESIPQVK